MTLAERINDLDRRASFMRRFGYIASADALQAKADRLRGVAA